MSASLAIQQGDFERAKASSQEALVLYRGLEDRRGIATSLYDIGWVEIMQGDDEQAAPLVDESLAMARESGNEWGISNALNALRQLLAIGATTSRRGRCTKRPWRLPGSWEAAE